MTNKNITSQIENSISKIADKLRHNKRIFLFGENFCSTFIINQLHQYGLAISYIFDNDKKKQGNFVCGIEITDVNNIDLNEDDAVIIASAHYAAMKTQLCSIANNIHIYSLFDFSEYINNENHKREYWQQDVFNKNINDIEKGESVYLRLYDGRLLVLSPTTSIGDHFLWNIYFDEFLLENSIGDYKIIVATEAARNVIQLFNRRDIDVISKNDMDELVSYIMYKGEKFTNSLIVYPRYEHLRKIDLVADWNGLPWQRIYANYLFKLKRIKCFFPCIKKEDVTDSDLKKLGLKKHKSVIISPYANTVSELPILFWEKLVDSLNKLGFSVFTNVCGNEKAISGSFPLELPLNACGNYLEYAGYFISIRNGMCDITGRAKCKKFIIYNYTRQLFTLENNYNCLDIDGIATNTTYFINKKGKEKETLTNIISHFDKRSLDL